MRLTGAMRPGRDSEPLLDRLADGGNARLVYGHVGLHQGFPSLVLLKQGLRHFHAGTDGAV